MCKNHGTNHKSYLESTIDQFLSFFEGKVNHIKSIKAEESIILFQKILYIGIIDALSKTVASPKKGPRERVVSLIRNFAKWDNCDRISLPHLVRMLQKVPDPEFSELREYAFNIFEAWRPGTLFYLDKDPAYNDINKLWPSNLSKPLENINLESFQHVNLFYTNRNSLVHELRPLGYGMEVNKSDEPFYHSMQTVREMELGSDRCTWELVYPANFYNKICTTAISELRRYYLKNRIDPYSSFTFGSYWIELLNM